MRGAISTSAASDLQCGFVWIDQPGANRSYFFRAVKAILSDWRKSKEFVEQDATLYPRSHSFNEHPMSSGRKLGDEAASQLAQGKPGALRPNQQTRLNENTAQSLTHC